MASPLRGLTQVDFSGGMNLVSNPVLLGPKQSQVIVNMTMDEHGSLKTRDGSLTQGTSPLPTPIRYLGLLSRSTGNNHPFVIQAQSGGNNVFYDISGGTWTQIGTFNTAELIPQCATSLDKIVVAHGYEVPRIYDGTTLVPVTAGGANTSLPPGAKHILFHQNYHWIWNTAPTTSVLDGPSSFRSSAALNANSWPNVAQTFISRDDGQEGMGLSNFTIVESGISPLDGIVLFKNYSAYQFTGVLDSATPAFSVQKIKSDMGCIAPRTIQFVSGFGVIRLTHKGFALYNGVDDRLISEEIRPAIFGYQQYPGINFTSANLSWAIQSQNPPLYIAAVPTGSQGLDRILAYDLIRRSWSVLTFPFSIQSMALIIYPGTSPTPYTGTVDGRAIRIFSGDQSDDGSLVAWDVWTRPFFVESPLRNSFFRRVIVDLVSESNHSVNVTATCMGLPETYGGTRLFNETGVGPMNTWGSLVWGQGRWSITPSGVQQGRNDIDILRTAPSCTVYIRGTGNVRLRGIEVQSRSKPLTKVRV